jgi:polyisoprenoid-binding protein YceI
LAGGGLLCAAALMASLMAVRPLSAEVVTVEMDPARTTVEFSLGAMLHTVHGTFRLTRGSIRFDAATGEASGELVADATSGASGNGGRDRRMHSDILESDRYREIVFRPDHVEGKVPARGSAQVQLHGMLTLHGTEHEMTLPVDVEAADGRFTATTHFTIPYVKWGLKNPSTVFLRVSDKVELSIHTVAHPVK